MCWLVLTASSLNPVVAHGVGVVSNILEMQNPRRGAVGTLGSIE